MAFVPAVLAPLRALPNANTSVCKRALVRQRARGAVRAELAAADGAATDAVTDAGAVDATVGDAVQAESEVSMPKLYSAWFAPGHELRTQMHGAVARAYADGIRLMELQWPVVPNLEEIAAGTRLNQLFGLQAAAALGMDAPADYPLVKRYLASFCNLYWAREVARAPPFVSRGSHALFSDGVSKTRANVGTLQVGSMRNPPDIGKGELAVVVDPRANDMWTSGARLKSNDGAVVFMNSQFSETYGLTGPRRGPMRDTRVVYYLKRVTRGYVFFAYPGPWKAYLENPDMSVEVVKEFEKEPRLADVAKVVREESNRRYGGFNNDRYVKGFGGRL